MPKKKKEKEKWEVGEQILLIVLVVSLALALVLSVANTYGLYKLDKRDSEYAPSERFSKEQRDAIRMFVSRGLQEINIPYGNFYYNNGRIERQAICPQDAIRLIMDHLGLEFEHQYEKITPAKTVLKKKEK
jgi:hypothetical protein